MPGHLASHSYGKHRVRVSKVNRPRQAPANTELHRFAEATVDIELEGAFEAAYTQGDNRAIVATDTCKNTVYALAKNHSLESIESFGLAIAEYFVGEFSQVSRCHVSLTERIWSRLLDSPHCFIANERATPTAEVTLTRDVPPIVRAGIEHLLIAKTTESGFSEFHESEYRTLADTDDRILATELAGSWWYTSEGHDFAQERQAVVQAMLTRFTNHFSRSVQESLYLMGQAAFEASPAIQQITLSMPNKHHHLADLSPFGHENHNEVFVATDEPFGYIQATLVRD